MSLKEKLNNLIIGGRAMMVNLYFVQVNMGWITLEQVPKKYRAKVKVMLDELNAGIEEKPTEEDTTGGN